MALLGEEEGKVPLTGDGELAGDTGGGTVHCRRGKNEMELGLRWL